MKVSRLRKLLLAAPGVACLAVVAASAATAGPRDNGRHVLPGTHPGWTNVATKTGDVPGGKHLDAKVWLAPRNAAQLDALAQAVSDPSNAQYQKFISADQYRSQFAPTADQIAQVTQWLTKSGLTVGTVGPDGHYIAVSGSASAMTAAFGAQLAQFAVNGKQEQAPTADLSVPDSVSTVVQAVTGLTTLGHRVSPVDLGAPAAFVNGVPCSDYYGQKVASTLPKFQGHTLPYAICGYVPSQLRGAYGVDKTGSGGDGQTVAITDAFDAPTLLHDANTYASKHGDRPFESSQFRDLSVPENASLADACGGNGWYGEQTLDVEAVHGMAPAASVHYYGAASCFDDDLLASLARIVSDNKASIVTNSWGEPTFVVVHGQLFITITQDLVNAYEAVFKQGAVQGVGFYFSSGDDGDELANTGFAHPDWPTEDPWVTSVGGSSLAIDSHNNRLFETGWGTAKYSLSTDGSSWEVSVPFLYGAGGGFSQIFDRPAYQAGVVPAGHGRAVPDIGMDGDPTTGMLVGETQVFPLDSRFGPAGTHYGEYRIGGTSLSSPLLAGVQADVQHGNNRIGFANPLIYSLARSKSPYFDVTPSGDAGNVRSDYANGINESGGIVYSVRTFNQDSSLKTTPGWDDVTGVGSATAAYVNQAGAP